jgi:hypothetical protein
MLVMIDSSRVFVLVHDLLLRVFLRSYYLRIYRFRSKEEYFSSISRSYKKYLLKQQGGFARLLEQGKARIVKVDALTPALETFVLEQSSRRGNTVWSNIFYRMSLKSILRSGNSDAYVVLDPATDRIVCFESNYRWGHVYYWLTTLIDAEHALSRSGMYFYFFLRKVDVCFETGIAYLRMGPTTDQTKIKMGGEHVRFFLR